MSDLTDIQKAALPFIQKLEKYEAWALAHPFQVNGVDDQRLFDVTAAEIKALRAAAFPTTQQES